MIIIISFLSLQHHSRTEQPMCLHQSGWGSEFRTMSSWFQFLTGLMLVLYVSGSVCGVFWVYVIVDVVSLFVQWGRLLYGGLVVWAGLSALLSEVWITATSVPAERGRSALTHRSTAGCATHQWRGQRSCENFCPLFSVVF